MAQFLDQLKKKIKDALFATAPPLAAFKAIQESTPRIQENISSWSQNHPTASRAILRLEPAYNAVQKTVASIPEKPVSLESIRQQSQIKTPFEPITSLVNIPTNVAFGVAESAINAPAAMMYHAYRFPQSKTTQEAIGHTAGILESLMAVSTPKQVVQAATRASVQPQFLTGRQKLIEAMKQTAKEGAQFGGAFGGLTGLKENMDAPSVGSQVVRSIPSVAMGAATGGVVGGIAGGTGHIIKTSGDILRGQARTKAKEETQAIFQMKPKDRPIYVKKFGHDPNKVEEFLYQYYKNSNRRPGFIDLNAKIGQSGPHQTGKPSQLPEGQIGSRPTEKLPIQGPQRQQSLELPSSASTVSQKGIKVTPEGKILLKKTVTPSKTTGPGNQSGRIQPELNLQMTTNQEKSSSSKKVTYPNTIPLQKTSQLLEDTPVLQKTEQSTYRQKKISSGPIIPTEMGGSRQRGFVGSVQEAGTVLPTTKTQVTGSYQPKTNQTLMGEAQALLQEGASLDLNKIANADQKVAATIQEAINQQKKNPQLAANLFNNLSEKGTELGRGVQAFALLNKMSPEAIALSTAGKIKAYNRTAIRKIPELTGEQVAMIGKKVEAIKKLTEGSRERNIAINELSNTINQFIPSTLADKVITTWKAGLLTSLRTTERNLFGNAIHGVAEAAKDIPATIVDIGLSRKTGKRTITPTLQGSGEFFSKQTGQQVSDVVKLGYDPSEDISKFDHKQITWGNSGLEQALKKYTDIVFRSLGAQDKPFYNAAFKRSLYSQAGAEAINAGKQGDQAFIENLVRTPTEEMMKIAVNDANVATFHNKNAASSIANAIKRELSKTEIGKLASEITMPFTGVPSSILGQIVAYSPAGLLKGMTTVGKVVAQNVPEFQRQAAQEIGRGVIGTGIFGLGAYLASKGLITGQPKDAAEQRQWDLENKPRNSIMIGGKWRSLNSIGPEAVVFLAGAKMNEELGKPEGSVGSYAFGLGKDYLDQSFVTGLQQPVNALTDPARYGKSYVGNQIASIMPNIGKDISKSLDTSQREANSITDYAKLATPGLRNTLIEKRDALGNVMKQEPTGLGAFFDLFNSKTPIDNAVVNELSRLNDVGYNSTPSKLTANQTIVKQKVKLTFDQLNSLEKGVGEILRPKLQSLIASSAYQQADDETKAKTIDSLVQSVRKEYKNVTGSSIISGQIPETQTQEKFVYITDDKGNVKTIDTSFQPMVPKLTGNKELNKKRKSKFYGEITQKENDIVTLNDNGYLTDEEAGKQLQELEALRSRVSGGKKLKVGTPIKLKPIEIKKTPMLQLKVPKMPKRLKLANSSQRSQRETPKLKLKVLSKPMIKIKPSYYQSTSQGF